MSINGPLGATAQSRGLELRSSASAARTEATRLELAGLVGVVVLGALLCVSAAHTPTLLSEFLAPSMEGAFRGIGLHLPVGAVVGSLALMFACYVVVVRSAERLSARRVLMAIAALNALVLLAPPLFSTDIFSYQGYAREWLVYGTNPYVQGPTIMGGGAPDQLYYYIGAKWISTPTVYGPLFTALSGLLAHASIATSLFWFKLSAAISSIVTMALIWHASRLRGLDPTRGVALFGLNPLVVLYGVGGGHNDLLMLVPATAALYLLLSHRERSSGAMVAVAAAIKLTAFLTLPFAMAAGPELGGEKRRRSILIGAGVTTIVIAAMSFGLFGLGIFNLIPTLHLVQTEGDWHSFPGFFSQVFGPTTGQVTGIVLGLVFLYWFVRLLRSVWRGQMDWIDGLGWATLALLVTASAVLPWYICWLLPVVALATDRRLWKWSLILSGVLLAATMLSYLPTGDTFLGIPVVP
jgi:alpha-1,6-mannosyltransferase